MKRLGATVGCWSAILLAAVVPTPRRVVLAQAPLQRAALVALHDSLRRLSDTVAVRSWEQRLLDQVRLAPQDPFLHLQLGWVSLRYGQLSGGSHLDDAASEFQFTADLASSWPWGWYSLGLAELHIAEVEAAKPVSLRAPLRAGAGARAALALTKALQSDSSFAVLLATLPAGWHEPGAEVRATILLETTRALAGEALGRDSSWLAKRGELERAFGRPDSAGAVYQRLLVRYPRHPAALRGYAITRLLYGAVDAASTWYRGLELADPATLALYRNDIAALFSSADLRRFDRGTPRDRVDLVRRYFEKRDVVEVRAPGTRLSEHLQRLAWVDTEVAGDSPGSGLRILQRLPRPPLDDRGLTYLRQGPPSLRVTDRLEGLPLSESWRYGAGDTTHVLHFRESDEKGVYRRVAGVTDLALRGKGAAVGDVRRVSGVSELLFSRRALGNRYRELTDTASAEWSDRERAERRLVSESVRWELASDRPTAGVVGTTPITAAAFGVTTSGRQGEVHLSYAIPATSIAPVTSGSAVRYPVHLRVHLYAPDSTLIASLDTLQTIAAGTQRLRASTLVGHLALPAPAGRFTLRAVIGPAQAAGTTPEVAVEVPNSSLPLAMSDLAIGRPGMHLPWEISPGDTVWMAPQPTLPAGSPLRVAFQVTGAASDGSASVEVSVLRARSGFFLFRSIAKLLGSESVRLSRSRSTVGLPASPSWVGRDVDLSNLEPGAYTLRVRVTSDRGGTVTRERPFTLER